MIREAGASHLGHTHQRIRQRWHCHRQGLIGDGGDPFLPGPCRMKMLKRRAAARDRSIVIIELEAALARGAAVIPKLLVGS